MEVKAGAQKFTAQELKLAGQLIDTLSGQFDPKKFHDEYRTNLERLIEQKRKGERVTVSKSEKPAQVSNILDALRKSLAKNKSAAPKTKSQKRTAA